MSNLRLANGDNGKATRNARGQFLPGHPGGPGNPIARQVAALRQQLYDAVKDEDFVAIVEKLVSRAKAGDNAAAMIVLDRLLGKASHPIAGDERPKIRADFSRLDSADRAALSRIYARLSESDPNPVIDITREVTILENPDGDGDATTPD